jgi:hypothetical protein
MAKELPKEGGKKRKEGPVVSVKERIERWKYVRVKVRVSRLPPPKRAKIELVLSDGSSLIVEGGLESAYVNTAYYRIYARYKRTVEALKDTIKETRLVEE